MAKHAPSSRNQAGLALAITVLLTVVPFLIVFLVVFSWLMWQFTH